MSAEHPTPWHLQGYTIRDAEGGVVVSAIAPCNMATRRQIVDAVNGSTGNMAAMREALEVARMALDFCVLTHINDTRIEHVIGQVDAALSEPARNCDVLPWRTAWDEWRTKHHPQKPQTYKESYESSVAFLEWFTTSATEEGGAE